VNILSLQAFNLAPKNGSPMFGNLHFDRCRLSPGRKIVVSFTTKLDTLILIKSTQSSSIEEGSVFSFISCEEKDYYLFVSVVQLGLTAARSEVKAWYASSNSFSCFFFCLFCYSGGITKYFASGNIEGLGETKTHYFPWG